MYSDKTIKSVADAARRIMEGQQPEVLNETLKGDQHKIDANKNGKIDAHDFELLRKKKKVEEEVELTESHFKVGDKVKCKKSGMTGEVVKLDKDHGADDEKYYTVKKEDGKMMKFAHNELTMVNGELEEGMKTQVAPGRTRNIGTHGRAKGADFGGTDWDKEESGKDDKPKRAKYGSRQNYVRSRRVNESFTDMLQIYTEGGIKSLLESLHNKEIEIEEEATNDEFKAELDKAQAKSEGREKANVAQALVTATSQVDEEVELDFDDYTLEELEDFMMSEDFEQLDELSKDTVKNYMGAATASRTKASQMRKGAIRRNMDSEADESEIDANHKDYMSMSKVMGKRTSGMKKAQSRLNKEDNHSEEDKDMKKNISSFKAKYATKQDKKDD